MLSEPSFSNRHNVTKVKSQGQRYPSNFEDFVANSICGWYGLTGNGDEDKVRTTMRDWTYTQRGDRAKVSRHAIVYFIILRHMLDDELFSLDSKGD